MNLLINGPDTFSISIYLSALFISFITIVKNMTSNNMMAYFGGYFF